MQKTRSALLVAVLLLYLACLSMGLFFSSSDIEPFQSGSFRVEDYNKWLGRYRIRLVNYIAEVGTDADILSPITPAPIGMHWFSLNIGGEVPRPDGKEVGRVGSTYLDKFQQTYNTSWRSVFMYDKLNRWLTIRKVHLGYADVFRVFMGENRTGHTVDKSSEDRTFDVAINLMTFDKLECGFTSKPLKPKVGDPLVLSCSVIINGLWNASLVFRNNYDESKIKSETKQCGRQPSIGSKICSTVRVQAETDILAYSCHLEFPPNGRHDPKTPLFQNSKWAPEFNNDVVCYLPKIYLEAIPSDVTFLCNNMPCGDTASVNDRVTCVAHGYPQPVFDLRIRSVSEGQGHRSKDRGVDYEGRFFMDTSEEESEGSGGAFTTVATEVEIKGSDEVRIESRNAGHVEITCNASNALGWGYHSLFLEVTLGSSELSATDESGKPTFRLEDYKYWRRRHIINLVNYVAEVGTHVVIRSPILPAPIDVTWFSLNIDGEQPDPVDDSNSTYFEKFQQTYNTSWEDVFGNDELNRWQEIRKVFLGHADVFRVFVKGAKVGDPADENPFDVAITLMIYEKHECCFASKPEHPIEGDIFVLNCSVTINGLWNTSLVFRNNYDESEIRGEVSECGSQPETGSKICSSVKVKAETDILAYSCRLEFPPTGRQDPKHPLFQNSKWTDKFNKDVVCYLPQVYLEVIPSDVSFLCNNMPCEDTASVGDTVTCVAHGYPQPVFDLRVQHLSEAHENNSEELEYPENHDNGFFMDTVDEAIEFQIRGSENYRIRKEDVGQVEITCNVSNTLGWGHNSLTLEVQLSLIDAARNQPGTFRLEDYTNWLENHTVHLVNYVAEAGTDVVIMSPITPAPISLRWFSRNMDGYVPHREGEITQSEHPYFDGFNWFYNTSLSWFDIFTLDEHEGWFRIQNVSLAYADAFRVLVIESDKDNNRVATFDVTTTLTIFEKHECGFTSKPQKPKNNDTLVMSCSVTANGIWQPALIFRNNYDQSEIIGETKRCGSQPSIGSKICSTVTAKADTDILAYSCRLVFFPSQSQLPTDTRFQSSQWTTEFNEDVDCYLPTIYLDVIPSDVSFLCNHMPCGDSAVVNDTVTCMAHGYPPPVFDIRVQHFFGSQENNSEELDYPENHDNGFFVDTADQAKETKVKDSEDYRIKPEDVGFFRMTCNVSNALGWGFNTLVLEVQSDEDKAVTESTPEAASTEGFADVEDLDLPMFVATEGNETDVPVELGDDKGNANVSEDATVLVLCNGVRCEGNHTLFVDDEISCIGAEKPFYKFELQLNENTTEGDNMGVRYVLQPADTGEHDVRCVGYLTGGGFVITKVSIIVRGNRTEQGEAAGEIDVGLAESIGGKPAGGKPAGEKPAAKPDSGGAAGSRDVPKSNDGMSAEKSAGDDKSKHDIRFVLLELFLVFVGILVGHVQF